MLTQGSSATQVKRKRFSFRKARRFSLIFLFLISFVTAFVAQPRPAQAICVICNAADVVLAQTAIQLFHETFEMLMLQYISSEFVLHRFWLTQTFFTAEVLPALMMFTEQMSAVGMHQVFIFGTFLDAKHQLETQRLFQELQFEAQRDYQPSEDFCWFGTNVRSMAATEALGLASADSLNALQMKRHLGNINMGASESRDQDKANRWQQFTRLYCDVDDNNRLMNKPGTGLQLVCQGGEKRVNNDIDYTRVIDEPRSFELWFDDPTMTDDEEDIIAMGNNLYGHDVLTREADNEYLKEPKYQHLYLALRSVAAKRNVAQNSFNALVALKGGGTWGMWHESNTREFLEAVMMELGFGAGEARAYLGPVPSYYAQLEVLAKKIYQNPDFFAGLYDSPANVARKGVAMKAIELMLDRAIYESQVRQEMLTSVLLSAKLRPAIRQVNRDLVGSGSE
ncbi:MAG: hypothetical protein DYH13_03030 [Alphaproteobacteria bacterium PRO2]|nr:hypothetical protein [Alphaproteobacteria bacterium PRO2]